MLVVSAIYGRRGDVSAARSTRLCKYENDARHGSGEGQGGIMKKEEAGVLLQITDVKQINSSFASAAGPKLQPFFRVRRPDNHRKSFYNTVFFL